MLLRLIRHRRRIGDVGFALICGSAGAVHVPELSLSLVLIGVFLIVATA